MRIDFVSLFPAMFSGPMTESIVGRARRAGRVELGLVDPRDFSKDRHGRVDARPFGGGAGMILTPEPLRAAIASVAGRRSRVVYLSPQGRPFDARSAARLAEFPHLVLVCGHYEGVDSRTASLFDEEISIGDYIVSGGELPAMVVADAVVRLIPGVLRKASAAVEESFSADLLEHPQYTRPRNWRGKKVPAVLLSGDHAAIAAWKNRRAAEVTRRKRPDLRRARHSENGVI